MDAELDAIFSVLASHYMPGNDVKPGGCKVFESPEDSEEFFKQKFDLSDEEFKLIRSKIDEDMDLNQKFERLEECLKLQGFEKADCHRDHNMGEIRMDGDYGLRPQPT